MEGGRGYNRRRSHKQQAASRPPQRKAKRERQIYIYRHLGVALPKLPPLQHRQGVALPVAVCRRCQ